MEVSEQARIVLNEETAVLKTVVESLLAQKRALHSQLSGETSRARALTSEIVATRRDEEKQLLASDEAVSHALSEKHRGDIEGLGDLIPKPYFARIKLEEQKGNSTKELEYKIGIRANPDCRIVDWRKAPISKLYYEYKEGEEYAEEIQGVLREGKVVQRNSLEIENSELKRVHCRHGSFKNEAGNWVKESGGSMSRGDSQVGTLPSVLSLITPEQFRLITEDASTAVLLQGVAGSGKTSVALHRMAWLLHEDNSKFNAKNCIVLVPSQILKAYISSTLPSLDVHGVETLSFDEWAARGIKSTFPQFIEDGQYRRAATPAPRSLERVKGSLGLLSVLEDTFRKKIIQVVSEVKQLLPWSGLPSQVQQKFEVSWAKAESLFKVIDLARELIDSTPALADVAYSVRMLLEEKKQILSKGESLVIETLRRTKDILAADDSKLLNEQLLRDTLARTAANFELGVLDPSDCPLLLRVVQLITGGVSLADGKIGKLDHIIVDEVQDLSTVALAGIVASVPNLSALTLVGDFHQQISNESGFSGWEKLKSLHAFKDSLSRYMALTVSHRSTEPIMKLAHAIHGGSTNASGRPGRTPIWFHCKNESLGIESAIKWLSTALERYPTSSTAVICRTNSEARLAHSMLEPTFSSAISLLDDSSFSFAAGLVVTDVFSAKGLEFKNVLLWNPGKQNYPDEALERNLLYVAITRAEENVCITTWNAPSSCLPNLSSPLVRGIKVAPEVESE